jgi:hypothetical protein
MVLQLLDELLLLIVSLHHQSKVLLHRRILVGIDILPQHACGAALCSKWTSDLFMLTGASPVANNFVECHQRTTSSVGTRDSALGALCLVLREIHTTHHLHIAPIPLAFLCAMITGCLVSYLVLASHHSAASF